MYYCRRGEQNGPPDRHGVGARGPQACAPHAAQLRPGGRSQPVPHAHEGILAHEAAAVHAGALPAFHATGGKTFINTY